MRLQKERKIRKQLYLLITKIIMKFSGRTIGWMDGWRNTPAFLEQNLDGNDTEIVFATRDLSALPAYEEGLIFLVAWMLGLIVYS
jgi:hypothetical protein